VFTKMHFVIFSLKMEVVCSSGSLVADYQFTRCRNARTTMCVLYSFICDVCSFLSAGYSIY